MNAILSIKPEYVSEIIAGRKRYEYRKAVFTKPVDKMYIYSLAPVSRVTQGQVQCHLEEIAMASEENWLAVKTEFEKKIKWRRKKFIHLNWYLENWEVKFMSKNTPVMDINEVKKLLQVG